MSKLTQISLDFGPEQPSGPAPPPTEIDAAAVDGAGKYMAADGVGVRLKSFKRSSESLQENGDPFGEGSEAPLAAERFQAPAEEREGITEEAGDVVAANGEEVAAIAAEQDRVESAVEPEAPRVARPGRKVPPKKGPSKRGRKSLKQVAAEADLIEIPEDEVLFRKQYYTMGEVSEMFRVNQSLLRFWETEFDILQPRKNKKGDRYFRPADIKNLHLIYHLLRQKKYTIEGAKEFLKKNKKAEERFEVIRRLQQIKAFLQEWRAQL